MSDKPYTRCVACGHRIELDDPNTKVVETMRDLPSFGQEHDLVWDAASVIHEHCSPPHGYRLRQDT